MQTEQRFNARQVSALFPSVSVCMCVRAMTAYICAFVFVHVCANSNKTLCTHVAYELYHYSRPGECADVFFQVFMRRFCLCAFLPGVCVCKYVRESDSPSWSLTPFT